LSGVTHSTAETPNPDALVPEQPQSPPLQPQPQQAPQQESPFALGPTGIPLHPEIRSVLRLNAAHQQKVYYSGRLSKRVERGTDGTRPNKDQGWIDIWCQLGGVTLSIWNMQAIEEANAKGEQVPPQYVNVTDAVCHSSLEIFDWVLT
jgi:CCR4-NOT transcriptional complex subunit CAF120